ncbi:MAG: N-acetyltransferase, partial [Planctomycetes bacterium]|nr:N-acetyltransferase [Planctomycetota bacterium]
GCLRRLSFQLNWTNEGFDTWGDFLARFRHKARVKINRELRRVDEQGITVEVLSGDAISEDDMKAMAGFYAELAREAEALTSLLIDPNQDGIAEGRRRISSSSLIRN